MWRGPWGMTLRELLALELRREAGFSVDLLAQDLQPLAQVVHRDPRALPGPHRLSIVHLWLLHLPALCPKNPVSGHQEAKAALFPSSCPDRCLAFPLVNCCTLDLGASPGQGHHRTTFVRERKD